MEVQIERSHLFGPSLEIKRGPGSGTSYWGETPIDLPDEGASIRFTKFDDGKKFSILIHFGYRTPSFKDYSRSIVIDRDQAEDLHKFLAEQLKRKRSRRDEPR